MARSVSAPKVPGDPVYGFRAKQPAVWFDRRPERSNRYCLYCGRDVWDLSLSSEKEHLIGREFVPTGTLDEDAFNLIFRACRDCNQRKGKLERHASTVTLFISPGRAESPAVDELARRKAQKDYHPHKAGMAVGDAHEHFTVPLNLGPLAGSAELVGPPQLDRHVAIELASYHVQGFFSLITSLDPRSPGGTRLLPVRDVCCWDFSHVRDWGNPRDLEVVKRVQGWKTLGVVSTAKGYFQAEFRRDESRTQQWFWALEWNKSTRLIGVIKHPEDPLPLCVDLPPHDWKYLPSGDRLRVEIPLASPEHDLLFRIA